MGANDPLGRGQFGPQGLDWQDLCRGLLPYGFREKNLIFSHYKSMGAIYRHGGHLDLQTDHFDKISIPL